MRLTGNLDLDEIDEICELVDLEREKIKVSSKNKARRFLVSKVCHKAVNFDSGEYFKDQESKALQSIGEKLKLQPTSLENLEMQIDSRVHNKSLDNRPHFVTKLQKVEYI